MIVGAIKGAVEGLAKPFTDIINEKVTDRDLRNELIASLTSQEMQGKFNLAAKQIDLAIAQAQSTNWFVAGSNPAQRWVIALGMLYAFLLQPIFTPVTLHYWGQEMPVLRTEFVGLLLAGGVGHAGLRAREKRLGVARDGGYAMHAAKQMSGGPDDK